MAVSLAPSPSAHDMSSSRSQPLASSSSASAFGVHAKAPVRPGSASGQHARQSPSLSAPTMSFPFSQSSPALSYAGQQQPVYPQQPFHNGAGPNRHVNGTSNGISLPPPVSAPGSLMGYAPVFTAAYQTPQPLPLPQSQHYAAPPSQQYSQRQQYPHPDYAAFSGVPHAASADPAAAGGYHPYRRPSPSGARPSPTQTRPPEQSLFSPPIGPADLARLRQDSNGSSSSGRPPRDTQPFLGRIRTQSINSNISSNGTLPKGAGFGEDRSQTPTPPRSAQPSPAPSAMPSHRHTSSTASAAAAVAGPPASSPDKKKSNKFVGGLRRAFSMQSLNNGPVSSLPGTPELSRDSTSSSSTSGASSSPPPTPPSRAMGPPPSASTRLGRLGMSRMNRSTDNISISSTVSSASMMIRKLGQIGKRSSLSGISAIFGKEREKDEVDTLRAASELGVAPPKSRKKDKKKSAMLDPSVSHATAELDRVAALPTADGLTPAEAMVKRHQQLMAQQTDGHVNNRPSRDSSPSRVVSATAPVLPPLQTLQVLPGDFDFVSEPSPVSVTDDLPTPTDETPRQSLDDFVEAPTSQFDDDTGSFYDSASEYEGFSEQPLPPRRESSGPFKGILKNAKTYNQEDLIKPRAPALSPFGARIRANSYDVPSSQALPTHHPDVLAPADVVDGVAPHPQRATSPIYSQPTYNVSAPMLHRESSHTHLPQRAVTAPQMRRCTFAQNLSVHTTWPATMYDRRGETATCNRLTPALAQRIKEELNDFKMTEMNVHAHSRIYTHFFV